MRLAGELEQYQASACQAGLWGCGGGVEQGALMRAGSLPPPGLVAVQLWKAAANGIHEHPCSWARRITPKVPCFQSEACNFSIAAFFFSPSLPLLSSPPQLSHFVVMRNTIHAVESLARSQMVLAAFFTPTERLSVLFSMGGDLSTFGAS